MIEYKLAPNAYHALESGKVLQAGGENFDIDDTKPVGDIISLVVKSGLEVEVYTHLQTSWSGRVTKARRRKVTHPINIGNTPFLLRSGGFVHEGISYEYNIRETYAGAGDMINHKSDVLCTVVKGKFNAHGQEELSKKVQKYFDVVNQFYIHLNDPRNTEKKVGEGPGLSKSQLNMLKKPVSYKFKPPARTLEFYDCELPDFELQELKSLHQPKLSVLEVAAAIGRGGEIRNRRGESKLEKVSWDEVGGFQAQKEQARRFVRQVLNPETAGYSGRDPAEKGGMIFLAPTGWGKSFFARACATEAMESYKGKSHYIRATYGNTGSMWRNQEAAMIAADFRMLREWAQAGDLAIYFLEEIQSTAERDEGPQKSNELLDELLAQTGDFDYTNVLMMAATARDLGKIDSQLVRGKRFGEHVFMGPPITEYDATDILTKIITKREKTARMKGNENLIDTDGFSYEALGAQLLDFSPTEIWYVVEDALSIRGEEYGQSGTWAPLTVDFLTERIKVTRSRRVGQSADVNGL